MGHYRHFCIKPCIGKSGKRYDVGDIWQRELDGGYLPGDASHWQVRHDLDLRDDDRAGLPWTPSGKASVKERGNG